MIGTKTGRILIQRGFIWLKLSIWEGITTDEIEWALNWEDSWMQAKFLIFLGSLVCVQNFYQDNKPVLLAYLSQYVNTTKVRFLRLLIVSTIIFVSKWEHWWQGNADISLHPCSQWQVVFKTNLFLLTNTPEKLPCIN